MSYFTNMYSILLFIIALTNSLSPINASNIQCDSCNTVVDILQSMKELMKVLNSEVCYLKQKVNQNCSMSSFHDTAEDYECLMSSLEEKINGKKLRNITLLLNTFAYLTHLDLEASI